MKNLIFSSLSVLLVFTISAPAFANGKVNGATTEACASIPPASSTGGATRERLEALRLCDMEVSMTQMEAMMAQMKAMKVQIDRALNNLQTPENSGR